MHKHFGDPSHQCYPFRFFLYCFSNAILQKLKQLLCLFPYTRQQRQLCQTEACVSFHFCFLMVCMRYKGDLTQYLTNYFCSVSFLFYTFAFLTQLLLAKKRLSRHPSFFSHWLPEGFSFLFLFFQTVKQCRFRQNTLNI